MVTDSVLANAILHKILYGRTLVREGGEYIGKSKRGGASLKKPFFLSLKKGDTGGEVGN